MSAMHTMNRLMQYPMYYKVPMDIYEHPRNPWEYCIRTSLYDPIKKEYLSPEILLKDKSSYVEGQITLGCDLTTATCENFIDPFSDDILHILHVLNNKDTKEKIPVVTGDIRRIDECKLPFTNDTIRKQAQINRYLHGTIFIHLNPDNKESSVANSYICQDILYMDGKSFIITKNSRVYRWG